MRRQPLNWEHSPLPSSCMEFSLTSPSEKTKHEAKSRKSVWLFESIKINRSYRSNRKKEKKEEEENSIGEKEEEEKYVSLTIVEEGERI